jgi:HPr kinase/phosphorylase
MNQITVKNVVKDLKLEVIYGNSFLDKVVVKPTSSRPSVEIYAGYFDYFESERIQVIGTKELTLFNMLSPNLKKERLEKMFAYNSPAYVFTKNVDAPKEFVEAAIAYQKPLLKSKSSTSGFIGELTNYLQSVLATREVIDGSMMEIYGIGVLIAGVAGIGKSETVLELIKNGHIMISDDLTQTYQVEPGRVICEALAECQSLMEVKDLGMINVEKIFGIGAIRHHKNLQLVLELVHNETVSQEYTTFFDTPVLKIQIQVEAGRNIATLIETAALNYRLKLLGQDATAEFESRLKNTLKRDI